MTAVSREGLKTTSHKRLKGAIRAFAQGTDQKTHRLKLEPQSRNTACVGIMLENCYSGMLDCG